jgi:hypothetical protein
MTAARRYLVLALALGASALLTLSGAALPAVLAPPLIAVALLQVLSRRHDR